MASYSLNEAAVAFAELLIDSPQYVLDSRTGLIACGYQASEWRHKQVELAAHDLLQRLDQTSG